MKMLVKGFFVDCAAELIHPTSVEEIMDMLFSIHPNKAPIPDGFNAFFYRRAWQLIGDDVVRAILSFFSLGKLLREPTTPLFLWSLRYQILLVFTFRREFQACA